MEWVKAPTYQVGKEMVRLLQVVCARLKETNIQHQVEGGPSWYWIVGSIEDYTMCGCLCNIANG